LLTELLGEAEAERLLHEAARRDVLGRQQAVVEPGRGDADEVASASAAG
jgi:hypothetical protein